MAHILEEMGLETTGTHGTVAALALLNDAVKKGGLMACSNVGGLFGSFIPISEDIGMIESAAAGQITLDKLEAMTAICSVGLDMVAVPGDTSAATLAAMIADEAAIGVMNHKRPPLCALSPPWGWMWAIWLSSAACSAAHPLCPPTRPARRHLLPVAAASPHRYTASVTSP